MMTILGMVTVQGMMTILEMGPGKHDYLREGSEKKVAGPKIKESKIKKKVGGGWIFKFKKKI